MSSKCDNYFWFHNWHNWGGGLNDHLMSTRFFTLIINKIFVWTPKLWGKWLWPWFELGTHLCINHLSHILGEVGLVKTCNHLRPTHLNLCELDNGDFQHVPRPSNLSIKQSYWSRIKIWTQGIYNKVQIQSMSK